MWIPPCGGRVFLQRATLKLWPALLAWLVPITERYLTQIGPRQSGGTILLGRRRWECNWIGSRFPYWPAVGMMIVVIPCCGCHIFVEHRQGCWRSHHHLEEASYSSSAVIICQYSWVVRLARHGFGCGEWCSQVGGTAGFGARQGLFGGSLHGGIAPMLRFGLLGIAACERSSSPTRRRVFFVQLGAFGRPLALQDLPLTLAALPDHRLSRGCVFWNPFFPDKFSLQHCRHGNWCCCR